MWDEVWVLLAHEFPAPLRMDGQQCVGNSQRDMGQVQEVEASVRQGMASGGLGQRARQVHFTDVFLLLMGPTNTIPRI